MPISRAQLEKGVQVATRRYGFRTTRIAEWMGFDGLVQLISVDGQRTVGCPYWDLVADVGRRPAA